MKSSKNIISQLVSFGKFQNIKTVKNLEKIKSILPPNLQKSNIINFMYIKNQILFIALNHQGFKMEMDMKLKVLKPMIKKMHHMIADFPQIDDVKTFVTNKALVKEAEVEEIDISYDEKSTGDFFVNTQNKELKKIFDELKEVIKSV